mmetsp:Transcript_28673/g.51906  ORF Transcript_28673/g.51906 Transcript_28673/m.51906 type:complete len:225 (+) Transcript_28673:118-792(+)
MILPQVSCQMYVGQSKFFHTLSIIAEAFISVQILGSDFSRLEACFWRMSCVNRWRFCFVVFRLRRRFVGGFAFGRVFLSFDEFPCSSTDYRVLHVHATLLLKDVASRCLVVLCSSELFAIVRRRLCYLSQRTHFFDLLVLIRFLFRFLVRLTTIIFNFTILVVQQRIVVFMVSIYDTTHGLSILPGFHLIMLTILVVAFSIFWHFWFLVVFCFALSFLGARNFD